MKLESAEVRELSVKSLAISQTIVTLQNDISELTNQMEQLKELIFEYSMKIEYDLKVSGSNYNKMINNYYRIKDQIVALQTVVEEISISKQHIDEYLKLGR